MAWGVVLSIILGIIFLVIYVLVTFNQQKSLKTVDVSPNSPRIFIHPRIIKSFTDDYFSGIVKTKVKRPNGTTFIEFYPDDVEQTDIAPRPDVKSFVVNNDYIKRSASGGLSGRREIITILPRSNIDLPEELQNTSYGKELTKEGQLAFIKSAFGDMIQQGDMAIFEAMKYYARGDITKATLDQHKQQMEELRKSKAIPTTPEGKEKTPSP